jgi:phosphatidylglycerol---prolipoprotein diacylglyceryl transferase
MRIVTGVFGVQRAILHTILPAVHAKLKRSTVDPVCFHIAGWPIHWYGVMMALAFLAGIAHWSWLGRHEQRPPGYASDLAFWIIIGSIVGARAAYVVSEWDAFRAAPWQIVRVDQGGLIYYGGFAGATAAVVILTRVRREVLRTVVDFTITAVPLGHALGRIGCFLNGCCEGRVAPASARLWSAGLARYPVQVYEALFNLAVYGLLVWFYRRRRAGRHGLVLALYLMVYPAGRFLLEFLRGDERMRWGGLTVAQAISLGLIAMGAAFWAAWHRSDHEAHRSG